jgi:hypothetical protein
MEVGCHDPHPNLRRQRANRPLASVEGNAARRRGGERPNQGDYKGSLPLVEPEHAAVFALLNLNEIGKGRQQRRSVRAGRHSASHLARQHPQHSLGRLAVLGGTNDHIEGTLQLVHVPGLGTSRLDNDIGHRENAIVAPVLDG